MPNRRSSPSSRLVLLLALAVSGCASVTDKPGTGDDASVCDGASCMPGGCDTEADCQDGKKCDVKTHLCVACLGDADCPLGSVCDPSTKTCAAGCSNGHGCAPDGGKCEADAGLCVECLVDADCGDPMRPFCEATTHRCQPCRPTMDICPAGSYCAKKGNDFTCAPGCKTDDECAPPSDGGVGGDGGGLPDGGGGAMAGHCSPQSHACVECTADDHCPLGKVCKANTCIDGCTAKHGCAGGLTCCNDQCTDVTQDFSNCGACGNACQGGWFCCNAMCSNPTNDAQNCGACGTACTPAHGSGACAQRTCAVGKCDAGWADCNGVYNDGCETRIDTNVNNCGACNNACNIAHASPKCEAGACQIDTCLVPWFDCNGMVQDGCETNVQASDLNNCGACNAVCKVANGTPVCAAGVCKIAACDAGFGDCDKDPKDGCEVDLKTSATNCGACGTVCAPAHASAKCVGGTCGVAACDTGWADCNGDPKDGCETNLNTDVANCGACGTVCSSQNASPACLMGACKLNCLQGFADCDKDATNGCEVNLAADVKNCSACGAACNLPHATPGCAQGICRIAACDAGWADCNGDPKDGCEINIAADPMHCGSCPKVCSSANGTPACSMGQCRISCGLGFDDCDGDVGNGCETNLNTNVASCGACGLACVLPHATPQCVGGACAIATCEAGYSDCDKAAGNGCEINTATDAFNCGACALRCSNTNGAASCVAGACRIACFAGFADCDMIAANGCEVSLLTDVKNCGACGGACNLAHATPSCQAGACRVLACDAGWADCNGDPKDGCEVNINLDAINCGGCGLACSRVNATPSCVAGACRLACNAGWGDCNVNAADGCETSINTDPINCGGCGTICSRNNVPTPSCAGGACNGACAAGFADCNGNKQVDGCEVGVLADVANCGGCNVTCSGNNVARQCMAGVCNGACNAGFSDCNNNKQTDGCETNVATSTASCGGCGIVCSSNNITAACAGGVCSGACNAGWADCNNNKQTDGCETNVATSTASCGGCGIVCSSNNITATCAAGVCNGACNGGWADCNNNKQTDGCETPVATDVMNCGACGRACSGNHVPAPTCGAGVCNGACAAGWADCNNNKQTDGCEINVAADTANCGGCGVVCSANHVTPSCANGVCNGACAAGYADCNNNKQLDGCETFIGGDANNCGGCGVVCSANGVAARTCTNGVCDGACSAGAADCNGNKQTDGCETNIASSPSSCGGCGIVCSANNLTPSCGGGVCNGACNTGYADCNNNKQLDGCEVGVSTDARNCGGCGKVCSSNNINSPTCGAGVCNGTCNTGYADCNNNKLTDGCEIAIATDPNNCGGCGTVCSSSNMASRTCGGGVCNGACAAGFADCNGNKQTDGCEINTTNSPSNCGGCGMVCALANATAGCANSACTVAACNAGWGNCDNVAANGCETNVTTSNANCGACGAVCMLANATSSCGGGNCNLLACNANYYNLDNVAANGCECLGTTNGLSCGAPISVGALNVGQSVTKSSNVVPGNAEVWYSVTFTGNLNSMFHPRVQLTANPNNAFIFDMRSDCMSMQSSYMCAQNGEAGFADARTDWETSYALGCPGMAGGNCDPAGENFKELPLPFNNGTALIRVRRNPNVNVPVACGDVFTITISN